MRDAILDTSNRACPKSCLKTNPAQIEQVAKSLGKTAGLASKPSVGVDESSVLVDQTPVLID
jgi:hypothetical protein